ncbi:hypothetical protein ScalyP_jg7667 [Parmales sp. scaly parma]|nr:hypothetical protein ScalyP_jg7667 [Parmales sp. scaly parma]
MYDSSDDAASDDDNAEPLSGGLGFKPPKKPGFGVKAAKNSRSRKRGRDEATYGVFNGEERDNNKYGDFEDEDDFSDDEFMAGVGGEGKRPQGGGRIGSSKGIGFVQPAGGDSSAEEADDDESVEDEGDRNSSTNSNSNSKSNSNSNSNSNINSNAANDKFRSLLAGGGSKKKSKPLSIPILNNVNSNPQFDNFAAARGLGLGFDAPPPQPPPQEQEQQPGLGLGFGFPPPQEQPFDIAKSSIGKWEKHTKGIGAKLLSKMGFAGRLGAKNRGVSGTVGVVVRPSNLGLGFGGFKEASKLEENKRMHVELKGGDYDQVVKKEKEERKRGEEKKLVTAMRGAYEIGGDRGGYKKQQQQQQQQQNKEKKKKGKKYISAADVINDVEGAGTSDMKIVDMRGSDVKTYYGGGNIMTNVAANETVQAANANNPPQIGAELLFNMTHTINKAEEDIRSATHFRKQLEGKVKLFTTEVEELRERRGKIELKQKRLKEIDELLDGVGGEGEGEGEGDQILDKFEEISKRFPEEHAQLNLINLLPLYLTPLLKAKVKFWDVFGADPRLVTDLFSSWQTRLKQHDPTNVILSHLFEAHVNPMLNRQILNRWNCVANPDTVVSLFSELNKIFHSNVYAHSNSTATSFLLNNTIMPMLSAAVDQFDPRTDTIAIHSWLHPWLPHVAPEVMSPLFPPIRKKLADGLKDWDVGDESALNLLEVWNTVFDGKSMKNLVDKCVVPKLALALRDELVIAIREQQNFTTMDNLCKWKNLLTPDVYLGLLEGEVMLRVLNSLWKKLQNGTTAGGGDGCEGKEDAKEFYFSWKGVLSCGYSGKEREGGEGVYDDEDIAKFLFAMLAMIQAKFRDVGDGGKAFERMKPPGAGTRSYERVMEKRSAKRAERERRKSQLEKSFGKRDFNGNGSGSGNGLGGNFLDDPSCSIRDVVEAKAEEMGVLFAPKGGARENGSQVFTWGEAKTQVYFKQNVVYARKVGSGSEGGFDVVSFSELMTIN